MISTESNVNFPTFNCRNAGINNKPEYRLKFKTLSNSKRLLNDKKTNIFELIQTFREKFSLYLDLQVKIMFQDKLILGSKIKKRGI